MKKRSFHIGPGAASLTLIAVTLALGVLAMLSLISARNDLTLSRRSAELAPSIAQLNARSEQDMARLDGVLIDCLGAQGDEEYLEMIEAALPEGMSLQGRTVSWTIDGEDGRALECAAQIAPLGDFPRAQWSAHRHTSEGGQE